MFIGVSLAYLSSLRVVLELHCLCVPIIIQIGKKRGVSGSSVSDGFRSRDHCLYAVVLFALYLIQSAVESRVGPLKGAELQRQVIFSIGWATIDSFGGGI